MPEQPDPLADGAEPNAARVLQRMIRAATGTIVKEHVCRRIIDTIVEPAREQGIAEGLRQATEGWERQWACRHNARNGGVFTFINGERARAYAADDPQVTVVSRLVGPWEPATEQPEPARKLMTSRTTRKPGNDTVALYCDECGELTCEHRCPKHSRDLPCRTCASAAEPVREGEALGVTDKQRGGDHGQA